MQDYRTCKPDDGRGGFDASRWPKAPPRAIVPTCSRAPIRPPSQAPRPPPRRRSRPGRAPSMPPETEAEAGFLAGAALARLDAIVQRNPAVGRRLAPAPRPASRGRQRCPRRPQRRRGGAARRAPPHSLRRRSRTGGTPAAGLARARGRIERDNGAPRSRAPPSSCEFRPTRRCKRRLPPPRLARPAPGRRRSPPRGRSNS